MMSNVPTFILLWISSVFTFSTRDEEFYFHQPVDNWTTPSGIEAYRSALTLDWLAAEDSRQRELAAAFETEPGIPSKTYTQDCMSYPKPSPGKVARLMLELLKNLEGDDGVLITDLIHALIRSKLIVLETSVFESEPDLEALVKTPGAMMGEPHVTFPRILAMVWLTVTDPATVKKHGWCHISMVSKYLLAARPSDIAKTMRALEPMVARARFVMEEFIQLVTPLHMIRKSNVQSAPRMSPPTRIPTTLLTPTLTTTLLVSSPAVHVPRDIGKDRVFTPHADRSTKAMAKPRVTTSTEVGFRKSLAKSGRVAREEINVDISSAHCLPGVPKLLLHACFACVLIVR